MAIFKKRKQDQGQYEHPDRDDHRFPSGQSFPPMDLMHKRNLKIERLKGEKSGNEDDPEEYGHSDRDTHPDGLSFPRADFIEEREKHANALGLTAPTEPEDHPELRERYGEKIGMWLEREFYFLELEADDPCVDNYRCAEVGNEKEEKAYQEIKDGGCCGSAEKIVKHASGRTFKIGLNYGH